MNSKLAQFLEELTALTNKYGIEIAGCGCCSSPYLLDTDHDFLVLGEELSFDRETKTYAATESDMGAFEYKGEMHYQLNSRPCSQEEFDAWLFRSIGSSS